MTFHYATRDIGTRLSIPTNTSLLLHFPIKKMDATSNYQSKHGLVKHLEGRVQHRVHVQHLILLTQLLVFSFTEREDLFVS